MISSDFWEMLVVFTAIVLVIKTIADYKTKSHLIRQGLVDEKVKHLFAGHRPYNSLSSLKWGLVLIGIGIALFTENLIEISDEAVVGLMFLFAGISFIIYHLLAKNEIEKDKNKIE